MLLEASIGDAFGAAFEYVSRATVKEHGHVLEYRQHPTHQQVKPGSYTDDTQMSLAIAEAMVESDAWTAESLAERFVNVFHRDPRKGYSRRLYSILTNVKNGTELLATIDGDSDRSGAAMRAYCIGLEPTIAEVLRKTEIQAKITHNSPLGITAAQASALMTHYFAYDQGEIAGLPHFINKFVESPDNMDGDWERSYSGKVGAQGWMSVKAAITALVQSKSMAELLVKCIQFTGDVDTVATIGLAAGSICFELEQNLPSNLYDQLENGSFGYDYIVKLDQRLGSLWLRNSNWLAGNA